MCNDYLAFVDEIGYTEDNEWIYLFEFSVDKDIIWGEYWNIAPANLVPSIRPDKKCLSKRFKVNLPYKMELACKNSCFSMQDCIDGIIALCFPNIYEEHLKKDDKPLFFNFGECYDDVIDKLKEYNINKYDESIVDVTDKTELDKIANGESNDDDNFSDEEEN